MHTSKLVNKPVELEASSIQLLRRLQYDNRLSSIPRLTSKGGTINFVVVCEEQGRYHRCANWTLDLDNDKLVENNLYDEVNCTAKITAHDDILVDILNKKLKIGPAVSFGLVHFEGDENCKVNLPPIFSQTQAGNIPYQISHAL